MSASDSDWEFCCKWYDADEVFEALQRRLNAGLLAKTLDVTLQHPPAPPRDVMSREFAEWLTEQYRRSMHKGMQMARRQCEEKGGA